ncbi:MAG: hypothetical protein ACRDJ9_18285 [Dehalococcoidia bacterium]
MGIPSEGSVRLDRQGLAIWLRRLTALEDRIEAQIARADKQGMYTMIGRDSRLTAAVELRDQHIKALLGALKAVRRVIGDVKRLRQAANKAGGYVLTADRDSADGMPTGN